MIDLSGGTSYTLTPLPLNVKVGNFTSIGEDCYFHSDTTHQAEFNHNSVYTTNFDQSKDALPIEIGHDTWIGRGVKVLPGVKIGTGAIVGAYSVISKDVPDFAVVVGNPQEIKRIRFSAEQIGKLMKIAWWNWPREDVLDRLELMKDINKFIKKYE